LQLKLEVPIWGIPVEKTETSDIIIISFVENLQRSLGRKIELQLPASTLLANDAAAQKCQIARPHVVAAVWDDVAASALF